MREEIGRLRAALVARMQELRAPINDPRLAEMLGQLQALVQQQAGMGVSGGVVTTLRTWPAAQAGSVQDGLAARAIAALPQRLRELAEGYIAAARGQRVHMFAQSPALSESDAGRGLLQLDAADKAEVAVRAYAAWATERYGGPDGSALKRIVSDLLRSKLDLTEAQAAALVKAAVQHGFDHASYTPNQAVLNALKRHAESKGLSAELRAGLSGLRARMAHAGAGHSSEGRKLASAVEALLGQERSRPDDEPRFNPRPDAWGKAVEAKLAALPAEHRRPIVALLALASTGGDNAKPAKGWLKSAEKALAQGEGNRVGSVLLELIECHEPGTNLALENQNTLRALLWLAAMATPDAACRRLEAYAQKCLTFSPAHLAYLSLVLGNAAIHAFSLMPGTAGVGSLSRLRRRLKRPGEVKTVDKALAALASARGMAPGELEEIGLPDYGFAADGTLDVAIGSAQARLAISAEGTLETTWRGGDGAPLSGPPAAVKDQHASALKALKAQSKEIGETLKAQRLRLERLYLEEREWPLALWQSRYLDEPLVAGFARRLIWSFRLGKQWVGGLPLADGFFDAAGVRLDLDRDTARVKLWHPMQSDTAEVLAWRHHLVQLGVTQPFKQAHREIYVLTDAERVTGTYSNRFAGHVVEQHRFRALCQARGWQCPTLGRWDPGNVRPLKRIPARELQVEYWVEPIETAVDEQTFQFRYLATDQVRFAGLGGEPIALESIAPVLFSELMRDVDLFVGVTSIGTDPGWADGGEAQLNGYWDRAAFGELTELGKTRRMVLQDLLPALPIASRCGIEDRYLVVQGKLRTYRIHLGSGNIQMEPDKRYLCVVQDRGSSRKHVRLPFEGDEMLSVIISKAFLLAEDDKIKDASIRSQIEPGGDGQPTRR